MAEKITRIKLNSPGIRKLLTSLEVEQELARRAEHIKRKAGPGYVIEEATGKARARVRVVARSKAAREAESKDGALRRALGGG